MLEVKGKVRLRQKVILGLLVTGLLLMILAGAWSAGLLPPASIIGQAILEKVEKVLTEPGKNGGGSREKNGERLSRAFPGAGATASGREAPSGKNESDPGSNPDAPAGTATEVPGEISGETSAGGTSGIRNGSPGAAGVREDALSPLRREIEAYYVARLEAICGYYEGRLNGLVGSAQAEYNTARREGQKISLASLARKYLAAGAALEKECDAEFYAVLADFKAELRKNSFPLDMPREAQKEYERAKAARKRQLLSAAAKVL